MPTNLPNRAQITYTFGDSQGSATSNQTNTTLTDRCTMTLTKTAIVTEVEAGGSVTYVLRLENTGAGALYNPVITDDLGTGTGTTTPLSYVVGSALFLYNGNVVPGNVDVTETSVTFTSAAVLEPGDNLIAIYTVEVSEAAEGEVTNTAEAQANEGAQPANVITATATETITVTFEPTANLAIFKEADKDSVVSGETLTYTFTILNTGDAEAEAVNFTDAFPEEFTVNSVAYTVNGTTTPIPSDDYEIVAPNTLVIPAEGSTFVISVPAATEEGPGIVVITVVGTVD